TDRLIAIQQNLRAPGVSEASDPSDVEFRAVAEADMGDGDELCFLIDEPLETLDRNIAVRSHRHVHYSGAAWLLGMPDLRVGREFKIAHDDLVPLASEIQSASERVQAGGYGGGHGNFIGRGAQQLCREGAHSFVLRHPHIPVRAYQ